MTKGTNTGGADNGVDVVQRGMKDDYEEEVKKELNLQMMHAAHLSTSPPRVYWMTQFLPVKSSPEEIRNL